MISEETPTWVSRRGLIVRAGIIIGALSLFAPSIALARKHGRVVQKPASAKPEDKPGLMAPYTSACVMEPATGRVIFDKSMHQPWPLASVTKMMLMLIVAEKLHDGSLKLTDPISTSRNAEKMGGSQVYLREGETFTLDDMMKAVVVHSANDATTAVAEYIGGSTDAFVRIMNEEAKRLGLADTLYYSVHGLPPGPGQQADISSAYDCALLARELVKYPDVLRWSSINTAPFRNGTFELRNTNHLVRTYPGCDGLKTGFYYKAGFNVVATAKRNNMRLIAVVLGSPRKNENFRSAEALLSRGFLDYTFYQVAKKGGFLKQEVRVEGGAQLAIKPVWAQDLNVFVKRDRKKEALKVNYELPPAVAAPVAAGQQLGKGTVIVDGKPAGSASLVSSVNVPKASFLRRLMNRF